MLGPRIHNFTVLADWHTLAYVDDEYKATFQYNGVSANQKLTTKNDVNIKNPDVFYQTHMPKLVKIMKDMTRFSK
jgi:hypothetical protein